MMDTLWIKLFGLIVVSLVLATFLNGQQSQIAALLVIGAVCCCAALMLPYAKELISFFQNLAVAGGITGEELAPLWKILGISICTRVLAELCRDCGQKALAAKTEIAGALISLACALPLLQKVLVLLQAVK